MSNKVVELKNINKEYYIYKNNFGRILGILFGKKPSETIYALKNVSLTIEKGERVYVFGKINSGVSTLQKIMAGIVYPTSGKVITNGEINCYFGKAAGFDNEMTCMDNMYMRANVIGVPKEVIKEHEEEIVEFAEIENYKNIALKQALKGTPARLGLAVHLLKDTDIYLMDENFSQGAVESKQKCEARFNEYIEAHPETTFIISVLGIPWAKKHCDRGIVLYKGEIVFDGPIEEAVQEYKEKYNKA
ncbi:MAG: ABC transporter ATP-binding protein [Eubacterium sp.]|nr:ABC transporter ATP-binding protein [Candidatus Colimonas fimequi]